MPGLQDYHGYANDEHIDAPVKSLTSDTFLRGLLYQPDLISQVYTVPINHFALFGEGFTLSGDGELIVEGAVYITVD